MEINLLGRLLYKARAIRIYKDGPCLGFVWCWWHPVSWILAPFTLGVHVCLEGVVNAWRYRHDAGWTLAPYYKLHPAEVVWITKS